MVKRKNKNKNKNKMKGGAAGETTPPEIEQIIAIDIETIKCNPTELTEQAKVLLRLMETLSTSKLLKSKQIIDFICVILLLIFLSSGGATALCIKVFMDILGNINPAVAVKDTESTSREQLNEAIDKVTSYTPPLNPNIKDEPENNPFVVTEANSEVLHSIADDLVAKFDKISQWYKEPWLSKLFSPGSGSAAAGSAQSNTTTGDTLAMRLAQVLLSLNEDTTAIVRIARFMKQVLMVSSTDLTQLVIQYKVIMLQEPTDIFVKLTELAALKVDDNKVFFRKCLYLCFITLKNNSASVTAEITTTAAVGGRLHKYNSKNSRKFKKNKSKTHKKQTSKTRYTSKKRYTSKRYISKLYKSKKY